MRTAIISLPLAAMAIGVVPARAETVDFFEYRFDPSDTGAGDPVKPLFAFKSHLGPDGTGKVSVPIYAVFSGYYAGKLASENGLHSMWVTLEATNDPAPKAVVNDIDADVALNAQFRSSDWASLNPAGQFWEGGAFDQQYSPETPSDPVSWYQVGAYGRQYLEPSAVPAPEYCFLVATITFRFTEPGTTTYWIKDEGDSVISKSVDNIDYHPTRITGFSIEVTDSVPLPAAIWAGLTLFTGAGLWKGVQRRSLGR